MSKKIKISSSKYTLIDEIDFDLVKKFKWSYTGKNGYVGRMDGNKKVYLHRFIINAPENIQVDHINHDKLDNRRENLRLVNQSQSNMNREKINNKHGFKGIYYYDNRKYYKKKTEIKTNHKNWISRIKVNGKYIRLGSFYTKEEAVLAYNKAAIKYFGNYAKLNKL